MPVIMPVIMIMIMMMMRLIQPARPGAEIIAQRAVGHIRSRCTRALPLDMVMVALLRHPHLALEPQHLRAVFAQAAVHRRLPLDDLGHPLGKGRNHIRVVVQIPRLDPLDIWMRRRHHIRKAIDPINQDAGEQEIRENNDPLVAKLRHML